MADYIYNNFPNDDDHNNNDFYGSYQQTKRTNANLPIILVCVFFSVLILLTAIFGFVIASKLSSSTSNKQNIDSLIFSSPVDSTTTPINPSATTPSTDANKEYSSYTDVIYAVKDSVVDIKAKYISNNSLLSESAGSGVIIGSYKADGKPAGYYVVTNAHVVEVQNGVIANKITITTSDGTEYPVTRVRGSDSDGDIAVLMIDTTDTLTGVNFGNSDNLVLGQEVIAIGNPLGEFGGSCTNGIISALDREVEIDGQKFKVLQTNAAINQGNSGGGLFNMKGQLIGIINAKSMGDGIEGIGFAIPSNNAKDIVEYLILGPFLGITVVDAVDAFSNPYVYVHLLEKGYNDNNLQVQDIILSMNGVDITTVSQIKDIMKASKPGDTIDAVVKRGNEFVNVTLTVYQKPY